MTLEEHQLMIHMLATQLKMYAELINVLRNKGVLTAPELSALNAAALDSTGVAELLSSVRVLYGAQAKLLGIPLDLPEPGESPLR